jgi:putative FmdB family regulatory protein
MPLYEYECEQCGGRFEVIQRFSDPAVETCRTCGGPVHKLISPAAIHFKGTGWYITDYAKKKKNDGGAPAPAPSTSSGTETKSDSASSSTSTGGTSSASTDTAKSAKKD